MCGIVGYIGFQKATPILVDGLTRLEYRGYDSAGIAVADGDHTQVVRSKGKISKLQEKLQTMDIDGQVGIGHTRWATHGKPSEINAHPHASDQLVLVHNGIIENYETIKKDLIAQGVQFQSETDTEVIPWLMDTYLRQTNDLEQALYKTLQELKGAFALALYAKNDPSTLWVAKNASPLIIGVGQGETFLASDIPALLQHTREVIILEDGQVAKLNKDGFAITDFEKTPLDVSPTHITWSHIAAEKEGYRHFMLKEIHEQPRAITDTLRGRLSDTTYQVSWAEFKQPDFFQHVQAIKLLACGTSYHAALVAQQWLEAYAQVPTTVEIASEFRYRHPVITPGTLCVAISQSGETADTLAAVVKAKGMGAQTLAICNVVESSIARACDEVLYTHAGPEIGVASTKAFTTQLVCLGLLTMGLGQSKKNMTAETLQKWGHAWLELPRKIEHALELCADLEQTLHQFVQSRDFLYLGRGVSYPIALEGALKLKEISYIHAEGYMGGELKHGPIALIDDVMPVVALAAQAELHEKMKSNIVEVKARGGIIIAVCEESDHSLDHVAEQILRIPDCDAFSLPVLQTIPLQLLSYHIATLRGCDVDQPRNLAKSVTVE